MCATKSTPPAARMCAVIAVTVVLPCVPDTATTAVEILRDEGKQLMALDDAFAHRERERNLFVRERHGG